MTAKTDETPDPLKDWEPVPVMETVKSLTGFDEIAVAQVFGKEFTDLSATGTARAALFVLLRRKGSSDSEAYRTAMGVSLGRLDGLFVKDDEDAPVGTDVDAYLDGRRPEA